MQARNPLRQPDLRDAKETTRSNMGCIHANLRLEWARESSVLLRSNTSLNRLVHWSAQVIDDQELANATDIVGK